MKLTANFALGAILFVTLPLSPIYAQDGTPTVAEAPPMGAPAAPAVYNWRDVPPNTPVVITRAVFDQGGYQLYCQTGETIVVPFENQNLYVMRFGRSEDGATHFLNDGVAPTLLVPPGAYLENAAAQGARWYPFPPNYVYTGPVYMGVAPSYHEYVDMGWYPGMVYYGGYWGPRPYAVGITYSPIPGLYFSIYDHPYYGWSSYHSYYYAHPEHRYYERTAVVFHYDSYRPRGVAYYHAHPEHSFVAEHRAAVEHMAEHHIVEHRAAAVMPAPTTIQQESPSVERTRQAAHSVGRSPAAAHSAAREQQHRRLVGRNRAALSAAQTRRMAPSARRNRQLDLSAERVPRRPDPSIARTRRRQGLSGARVQRRPDRPHLADRAPHHQVRSADHTRERPRRVPSAVRTRGHPRAPSADRIRVEASAPEAANRGSRPAVTMARRAPSPPRTNPRPPHLRIRTRGARITSRIGKTPVRLGSLLKCALHL